MNKIKNFILIILLIIGCNQNIFNSFASEISDINISYDANLIDNKMKVKLIIDENTSFQNVSENKKYNIESIINILTNQEINSLEFELENIETKLLVNYTDNNLYKTKEIKLKKLNDKNEIRIDFDGNGETSGQIDSLIIKDEIIKLPLNEFKKENYSFLGWNSNLKDANNGIVEYYNGQEIEPINSKTLYAVWGISNRNKSSDNSLNVTVNGNSEQNITITENGNISVNINAQFDAQSPNKTVEILIPEGISLVSGTGFSGVNSNGTLKIIPWSPEEEVIFSSEPQFTRDGQFDIGQGKKEQLTSGKLIYRINTGTTSGCILNINLKPETKVWGFTNTVIDGLDVKIKSEDSVLIENNKIFECNQNIGVKIFSRMPSQSLVDQKQTLSFGLDLYDQITNKNVSDRNLMNISFDVVVPKNAIFTLNNGYSETKRVETEDSVIISITYNSVLWSSNNLDFGTIEFPNQFFEPNTTQPIEINNFNSMSGNSISVDNNQAVSSIVGNFTDSIKLVEPDPFKFYLGGSNSSAAYEEGKAYGIGSMTLTVEGSSNVVQEQFKNLLYEYEFVERDHIYDVKIPCVNKESVSYNKILSLEYTFYGDDKTYTWNKEIDKNLPPELHFYTATSYASCVGIQDRYNRSFKTMKILYENGGTYNYGSRAASCSGRPDYNEESRTTYSQNKVKLTVGDVTKEATFGFKYQDNSEGEYRIWGDKNISEDDLVNNTNYVDAGNVFKVGLQFHQDRTTANLENIKMFIAVPNEGTLIDYKMIVNNKNIEFNDLEFVKNLTRDDMGYQGGGKLYKLTPKEQVDFYWTKQQNVTFEASMKFPINSNTQEISANKFIGIYGENKVKYVGMTSSSGYKNGNMVFNNFYGLENNATNRVISPNNKISLRAQTGILIDTFFKKNDIKNLIFKGLPGSTTEINYDIFDVTTSQNEKTIFLPLPRKGQKIQVLTANAIEPSNYGEFDYMISKPIIEQIGSFTYNVDYATLADTVIDVNNYSSLSSNFSSNFDPNNTNCIRIRINGSTSGDELKIKIPVTYQDENSSQNYFNTKKVIFKPISFYDNLTWPAIVDDPIMELYQLRTLNYLPGSNGDYTSDYEGSMDSEQVEVGSTINLKECLYTRKGYEFTGWKDLETGIVYNSGDEFVMPLKEVNLEAQWEAIKYTYNFITNSLGSVSPNEVNELLYNNTINLNTITYTPKEGYEFIGLGTEEVNLINKIVDPNLTKEKIQNNEAILTVTENRTFYVIFDAIKYTINFDGNGATSGNIESIQCSYDKNIKLPMDGFVREGYTLVGWYDESNQKDYNLGQVTKNLTNTPGIVVLKAKWQANEYTITYKANGGVGAYDVQTITYDTKVNIKENSFSKEGYTFVSWNTQADGSGTTYNVGQEVSNLLTTGNIDLYAQWQANEYTITYKANGGVGVDDVQTVTYDTKVNIKENSFSKEGYTFVSWNTQADGSGTTYNVGQEVSNLVSSGNINLFAQWDGDEYTVTYKSNGGTGSDIIENKTYDEKFNIINNLFVREGYSFKNWNTQADGTGTSYTPGQEVSNLVSSGNIDLYAQWQPNQYVVEFNANGGIGVMESQDMIYDVEEKLNVNKFTKEGYTFIGWDTEKTKTFYQNEELVKNLVPSGTITLYAVWKYGNPDGSITLPGNDGSITDSNVDNPLLKPEGDGEITVNPDGSVTLPSDEKGEITFPNNPDNDDIVIVPEGSTVKPDGSITLTNGIEYNIKDNGNIISSNGLDLIIPNNNQEIIVNSTGDILFLTGGKMIRNNCEVKIENNGKYLSSGFIKNPGKDNIIDTNDDEIINPDTACNIYINNNYDTNSKTGLIFIQYILFFLIILFTLILINRRK